MIPRYSRPEMTRIWEPETWAAYLDTPDGADILECQNLLPESVTATMIRDDLAAGYAHDLAAERA